MESIPLGKSSAVFGASQHEYLFRHPPRQKPCQGLGRHKHGNRKQKERARDRFFRKGQSIRFRAKSTSGNTTYRILSIHCIDCGRRANQRTHLKCWRQHMTRDKLEGFCARIAASSNIAITKVIASPNFSIPFVIPILFPSASKGNRGTSPMCDVTATFRCDRPIHTNLEKTDTVDYVMRIYHYNTYSQCSYLYSVRASAECSEMYRISQSCMQSLPTLCYRNYGTKSE